MDNSSPNLPMCDGAWVGGELVRAWAGGSFSRAATTTAFGLPFYLEVGLVLLPDFDSCSPDTEAVVAVVVRQKVLLGAATSHFFPVPSSNFCQAATAVQHGQGGRSGAGATETLTPCMDWDQGFVLGLGLRPCLHRSWLVSMGMQPVVVAARRSYCYWSF